MSKTTHPIYRICPAGPRHHPKCTPEGSFSCATSFYLMRQGRGTAVLLVVLLIASLLPALPAKGDTNPPTITSLRWTPQYPISPSNVTLYANVSDPDGVALVQATWCAIPPFLCTFPQMFPIGNGVYQGND